MLKLLTIATGIFPLLKVYFISLYTYLVLISIGEDTKDMWSRGAMTAGKENERFESRTNNLPKFHIYGCIPPDRKVMVQNMPHS